MACALYEKDGVRIGRFPYNNHSGLFVALVSVEQGGESTGDLSG